LKNEVGNSNSGAVFAKTLIESGNWGKKAPTARWAKQIAKYGSKYFLSGGENCAETDKQ